MCDRKFRKLQKIAYSIAEMQIYNISSKGQKSLWDPKVGFLLSATQINNKEIKIKDILILEYKNRIPRILF